MVRDCVRDYLTLLMENALRIISEKTMSHNLVVNLTLTRPTTWTAAVVEDYRSLARKAFEEVTQRCSPAIFLRLNSLHDETESHAAGVFVFEENNMCMGRGSIFYVLDVGGATTDPALLQAVRVSSGSWKLKSLMNPPVPGIQVGCADLDNRFSDRVLLLLRSIWKQQNFASDIGKSPLVLSMMTSTAKALKFDQDWIKMRNKYSEDEALPYFKLKIPAIPSDEKNGVHGLPERTIIFTRSDMKAVFDEALITPIREHLSEMLQILSSLQGPQEKPFEIAHIILYGGGGLIPRVYECVHDQIGSIVTRTDILMAPSLGALHLVKHEVRHMHATLKVGTKKLGGGPGDVVWLTGVVPGDSSSLKPPMFSQQWKHRVGPEAVFLRQHFVLVFVNELEPGDKKENWVVHLQIDGIASRSWLGALRSCEYRICLTLPSTTDVVTPINFSAFQIYRDGRETKIECTASKVV